MRLKYILVFLFIYVPITGNSQIGKTDFKNLFKENLEFSALKSFFYLISQEYIVVDKSTGEKKLRGGNDFYGKACTIGVLSVDTWLWFPSSIKAPWELDKTYDKGNNSKYKPEFSFFNYKRYSEQEYNRTKLQHSDEKELASFLKIGEVGIPLDSTYQSEGTLIVFTSNKSFPDDFADISQSIIFIDSIKWNSDGIAEIGPLDFNSDQKIGGALFSRNITPGKIEWKLSGLYLKSGDKWLLKSILKSKSTLIDK